MSVIAIEEHFTIKEHIDALRSLIKRVDLGSADARDERNISFEARWVLPAKLSADDGGIMEKLLDVEGRRINVMDEAGVDMQVLSIMSPGVQAFESETATVLAKSINEKLAAIIGNHPGRYAGLATIAPQDPKAAADELKRAVMELGLRGVCIHSHTKGEYLDDRKYWDIFAMAEKLAVPIYLHPRIPSPDMVRPYLTYPCLATGMWGFSAEASLHAMRLICSGLFDHYPGLKIVLGHFGEALPFWIWRLDNRWQQNLFGMRLKKKPGDYVRENFLVTTSGMFYHPSLQCAYSTLSADRILFAVDYPFESCNDAVTFIKSAPISDNEKGQIFGGNAEKLLKLQA
jgi:5-carboxyvanillate decarboxylase